MLVATGSVVFFTLLAIDAEDAALLKHLQRALHHGVDGHPLLDVVTAVDDRAKGFLQRRAENEPFFKSINSSMEKQPLPSFSVLQKYLAPGGSIVVDDETGLHWMNFTLKRKTE